MANIRIEAEQMALSGYVEENSRISSGGKVINVGSGTASASTRFSEVAGLYDLSVVYHDENDGESQLSVWVNGTKLDGWTLNEVTDSPIATVGNRRSRTLSGISLNPNDLLEIRGTFNGNEYARVDYLDISPNLSAPVPSVPASSAPATIEPTPSAPAPSAPAPSAPAPSVPTPSAPAPFIPTPITISTPPVAPSASPTVATFGNSTTGIGRLEAEDMGLIGYSEESSSVSSGGAVINVGEASGTAITKFTGTSGRYDLSVAYHDENDGESPLSVKVDGVVIDSWTMSEATDSTIASTGNLRTRSLSGVALNTNSIIEIKGAKAGNEYARVDYIDIAIADDDPDGTDPGGITSTVGLGRLEAEQMTLSGYTSESSQVSSGGAVINVGDGSGTAATRFTGSDGSYDLSVAYHDESDGNSPLAVKVDGVVVDSWTMSEATDSTIASTGNLRTRTLTNVSLENNSVIEILGAKEGNEFARVDYIEVAAAGTQPPVTVGDGITLQAEDALLSGAVIDSMRGGAQGGLYADFTNANNDFIEWTVNADAAESYDLAWRYANGSTNRPLALSVNGQVVDGSLDFNGTGSWTNWQEETQTVALNAGTNKIRLSATGSSGANFDSLRITPSDSTPPTTDKLRILPLGDSNTRGEGTPGGYRIQFWERAVNDGVDIDFLGTRNNGPSSLGDGDHQGQGGWAIPQMTEWVNNGNLVAQNPEIILFMMGTNDANQNGSVSGAQIRDRLSTFIDAVANALPSAHMFVSSIMPLDTPRGTAAEAQAARDFNALIPALVNQKAAEGKNVSFVDAGGSLTVGDINGDNSATNDQNDGLHATAAGYDKLGDAWYDLVSQSSVWQSATGQSSASLIAADQATNLRVGDARDNILEGGAGFDELAGRGGADTFVYREPSDGVDRILDFDANDTLRISASGFGGGLSAGDLVSDYVLGSNPTASTSNGTFLFNTSSNTLSFDANGSGSGSVTDIATFSNGFAPLANQLEIVV